MPERRETATPNRANRGDCGGFCLIAVETVAKRYGKQQVLRDVTFAAPSGQITAIVGKNGCGKSTLLSIAAGMLKPDSGKVLVNGRNPFADSSTGKTIGFVAQDDCLFEDLTVGDNLRFWASASGVKGRDAAKDPFVKILELEPFLKKKVSALSGGMRRRTAICTALFGNPACLLLDEPFSGLDLVYQQELSRFLLELREMGKTLIYTTHSPEELTALSDSVLLLSGGRIIFSCNTTQLVQQDKDVKQLLISLLLRGEIDNERG